MSNDPNPYENEFTRMLGIEFPVICGAMYPCSNPEHWMRSFYMIASLIKLKNSSLNGAGYKKFFQAGKSVEAIDNVLSVAEIFEELRTGSVSSPDASNSRVLTRIESPNKKRYPG